MTNNSVVIGGLGIVGAQTCRAFGIKDYIDLKGSTLSWGEAAKSKRYFFICVPTPAKVDGGHDDSIIEEAIKNVYELVDPKNGYLSTPDIMYNEYIGQRGIKELEKLKKLGWF